MPRACPRPLLGDPPVVGRSRSGLPHTRVQPEIADQLLAAGEAFDIADRRHQRAPHDHIDAGDRHQAVHFLVGERRSGDHPKIVAKPVELAQVTLHGQTLVAGQDLLRKPGTALGSAQILMANARWKPTSPTRSPGSPQGTQSTASQS